MNSQQSNLVKCTVFQKLPAEVPLPSNFDTQGFITAASDSIDNDDRNSLSGMKHAHDTTMTVFQVKASTMKSKPKMSSTDISTIKNLSKRKCQEVVSFHYNQKVLLENTSVVD